MFAAMLSRIGARRYRCFSELDVPLHKQAVLAGANGSGKSTLIDIPVFIGEVLSGGLHDAALRRAQDLRELFHNCQPGPLELMLEAQLPDELRAGFQRLAPRLSSAQLPTHVRYEIQLQLRADQIVIEAEHLDLFPLERRSPALSRPSGEATKEWRSVISRDQGRPLNMRAEFRRGQGAVDQLSTDQLALGQARDRLLFPAATWFADLLRRGTVPYAPDYTALRRPSAPGAAAHLRGDAANLPWQVLQLQQTNLDLLNEWSGVVRLALPSVQAIAAVIREEDRHAYLRLTYGRSRDQPDYTMTSSGLSDGTLRLLAFTVLPYLEGLPPLLTVEQPEDGIHPRALDVVLESLSALPQSQVLLTTQSPLVVACTPLERLLCMRKREDGSLSAVSGAEHPRLADWRQEVDLGVLFAAGILS